MKEGDKKLAEEFGARMIADKEDPAVMQEKIARELAAITTEMQKLDSLLISHEFQDKQPNYYNAYKNKETAPGITYNEARAAEIKKEGLMQRMELYQSMLTSAQNRTNAKTVVNYDDVVLAAKAKRDEAAGTLAQAEKTAGELLQDATAIAEAKFGGAAREAEQALTQAKAELAAGKKEVAALTAQRSDALSQQRAAEGRVASNQREVDGATKALSDAQQTTSMARTSLADDVKNEQIAKARVAVAAGNVATTSAKLAALNQS